MNSPLWSIATWRKSRAAIAKAVRRRKQKFIAVSCHHDIIEWLQPDWIYEPAGDQLTLPRGSLQRPKIELEIFRVHYPAWELSASITI